ncbi:Gfo/Idh/MocA family protein [Limobrevibacterium gyesilva]|uniref:Gfo/Idh/MocA family oxidoreductase n=1 Tax=Limobrevibacterium gyesilva TaxID=2991712 RepID=A0AA41YKQ5_9PROT|nr:Gfo/Idh/MocA family oxidoreductase [Limobrevibacterium gyesilva]MCW3475566.1 Gfo/Idh/MocA family oxidoreductase [Limobrevibacterium gyesilva]
MTMTPLAELRVGFVGAGFMARFHLQSLLGVRKLRVAGVFAPTPARRQAFADDANLMDLGPCRAFDSLEAMLASGEIDAIWLVTPNHVRLDAMRAIHAARRAGQTGVFAIACEKPLARTLAEAREMLRLAEDAGLIHGYLENQLFSTAVQRGHDIIWRRAVPNTGRPYIARAAEEHSGPHEPWFWNAGQQGGGVLSDMMCHSVEVARYLLTAPGETRDALRLRSANASVATLKWRRPAYAEKLRQSSGGAVDYVNRPAEDFARGMLTLEDPDGNEVVIEATTSWAYVGPGLRITLELLGPEYAMEYNSLGTGLKVFLSRAVSGRAGEDLVEKQNAEQGSMPVLEDEAGVYGYTLENRHFADCFRRREAPMETFRDGVAVVEMLMALYRSAELGRTVMLPDPALETYVPEAARRDQSTIAIGGTTGR